MKVYEILDRYKVHDLANPDEDSGITKINDIEKLAETIKHNCKDTLRAYQHSGDFLYRGIKNVWDKVIITGIRPDRRPVEMKPEFHEILHDAFLKLGLRATRKNAIFCTTNIDLADDWGNVYVIFPKDGWDVTVFTRVTTGYSFHEISALSGYRIIRDESTTHEEKIDFLAKEIGGLNPQNIDDAKGLTHVLKIGYEDILLTGDSYIGVRIDNGTTFVNDLFKLLEINHEF